MSSSGAGMAIGPAASGGGGGGGSPTSVVLFQWNQTDVSQFSSLIAPATGASTITFGTGSDGLSPVIRIAANNLATGPWIYNIPSLVMPRRFWVRIRYLRNDGSFGGAGGGMGWWITNGLTGASNKGFLMQRYASFTNTTALQNIGGVITDSIVSPQTSQQVPATFPGNVMDYFMVYPPYPIATGNFPEMGLSVIEDYSQVGTTATTAYAGTIFPALAISTPTVWNGVSLTNFGIGAWRLSAGAAQTCDIADLTILKHPMDW